MAINNNLYPPIIATYMPAFIRTKDCKVVFSLSSYNSLSDIDGVEILLRYQSSDRSALANNQEILELSKKEIFYNGSDEYGLYLKTSYLKTGIFEENTLYKLQIRFKGKGQTSEWSTVCLILGINSPMVYLKGLDMQLSSLTENSVTKIAQTLDLVGTINFNDSDNRKIEKSYLFSWQAKIYEEESNSLVYDTDIILTKTFSAPNEINYTIPYTFELGKQYYMLITFTTNNGYIFTKKYSFKSVESPLNKPPCTIEVVPRLSLGALDIVLAATGDYKGNLTIRRASGKDNFSIWQDIYTNVFTLSPQDNDIIIHDTTVESGVLYKYLVQKRTPDGGRGAELRTEEPTMVIFDDTFLSGENGQYCVKFNNNISSLTWNKQENKTETLGSQYAYIRKNSSVFYRSFPISGTISYLGDTFEETELEKAVIAGGDSIEREPSEYYVDEPLFYNRKKELSEEVYNFYNEYNKEHQIKPLDDIIYEKEFRDKVISFLEDGKVKLFRSPTEGNILIRLMDISYSPNQVTGRKIYDFSATAIEIDKVDFDSLNRYNLHSIGNPISSVKSSYDIIGQTRVSNAIDLFDAINEYISNYQTADTQRRLVAIKNIRLTFENDPVKIDDTNMYGYKIQVNNEPIIVGTDGIYQVSLEDGITSLKINENDVVLVDYLANVDEMEINTIPKISYDYFAVSQFSNYINYGTDLIDIIKNKYNIYNGKSEQSLKDVYSLRIEADENTVFKIKTKDSEEEEFIIGDNELINFGNPDYLIESCIYVGSILYYEGVVEDENGIVKNTNYRVITLDTSIEDCALIGLPKENCFYYNNVGTLLGFYKNGRWCPKDLIDGNPLTAGKIYIKEPMYIIADYSCLLEGKEY